MSTLRQVEANRRNSQRSTGPRTPEGKAVCRFNALKSGINAKAQVIPGEDPAELEAITAGYHQDWAPVTYLERFLVDSLVRADWLLQRLSRLEAELWVSGLEDARKSTFSKPSEKAPIGDIYSRTYDRFTRLQRRIDSTERSYYRALTQLQHLRREADCDDGPPAEPVPESLPSEPPASDSLPGPLPSSEGHAPPSPVPPAAAELASFLSPRVSASPLPALLTLSARTPALHPTLQLGVSPLLRRNFRDRSRNQTAVSRLFCPARPSRRAQLFAPAGQ